MHLQDAAAAAETNKEAAALTAAAAAAAAAAAGGGQMRHTPLFASTGAGSGAGTSKSGKQAGPLQQVRSHADSMISDAICDVLPAAAGALQRHFLGHSSMF